MVREITRRKQAELEREETIDELRAFAHTVAHDLKNPLNIISGYTALMADDNPFSPTKTQEVMTTVHDTGKKMASIIDELMLLTGLNQQEPEFQTVDMNTVLHNLQERMALLIAEYEAQIDAPEEWPELVSYAPWIEEVLSNFVSNAIKYGGHPPQVQIGAVPLADGRVGLWVRDNGAGISPADQARLFTPFTRLNQLDTKGHGLGLSIVQRIATRLDGEPTVESTLGQGSTFSLILPGLPEALAEAPQPVAEQAPLPAVAK
ncbi:ATP-binding protein [Chloroflexota bacterium]